MKSNRKYLSQTSILIFSVLLFSCSGEKETKKEVKESKEAEVKRAKDECPKGNHTDSIIPVIYGDPTEETVLNADSGKVFLRGCEMPENPALYWCKIHKIEF